MPSLTPAAKRDLQRVIDRARHDKPYFAKAFFGLEPTPWQVEALGLNGRINTKDAGRRSGKSTITVVDRVHDLLFAGRSAGGRPREGYVTGPSIDQANLYFLEVEKAVAASQLLEAVVRMGPAGQITRRSPFPEITFVNGAKMMGRATARNGMYLRGKGADWVAVTEAAFIKDQVYNEVIRALVLDRRGRIDLESTPNGDNYFKKLFDRAIYQAGQHRRVDKSGRYQAVYATVFDNLRLDPQDIEDIRQEVPDYVWQVEYLALFLSDADTVFPWELLAELFDEDYPMQDGPQPGHLYCIGVDLAQVRDYTVIVVLDVTRPPYRVAAWRRYRGKPYTGVGSVSEEVNAIRALFNRCPVYVDATNERAVAEQVEGATPFVFSQASRNALFSNLQVLAQRRLYQLPPSWTTLRDELRTLRRVRHGLSIRLDHPSDGYDDTVVALGLASWPLYLGSEVGSQAAVEALQAAEWQ